MNTFEQLVEAWKLVKAHAPVFTGKPAGDDLNWAMQQIRETGKPAGDIPAMNQKASEMLNRWMPSLTAQEAGEHIRRIHALSYALESELVSEFVRRGYSNFDAVQAARQIAYGFQYKPA